MKGASTSAGKAVQQQACDGSAAQVWELSAVGEAYHLVNANSSKCLNVKSALAQQNSCDKASSKSWTLLAEGEAAPSTSASASASPSASPTATKSATASPSASTTKSATASASASTTMSATSGTALAAWPTPTGNQAVSSTIEVSGTYDGSLKRFHGSGDLGSDGQSESQGPLFELADGAVLKNVVLGSPAADGVHCLGSCTLQNVWWEDVGEDAASFKGKSTSAKYLVDGGGARKADDKVLQFNGAGTLTVRNFQVEDFGKLVRSCGNCSTQYQRHIVISNVKATAPGKVLVGVNANYGDTATLSGVTVVGDKDLTVCERFKGNSGGDEPTSLGEGPDGTTCRYSTSDVTHQ
ncbi:pectate lyase [Streptomyces sp. PSKA01]|uniref:Pectate lyase n=1 Tax=Streptomyces cupreus TaxID=2759956 RepID=A0A7X1MAG7_9ACTN|nr:pectate lyase [Streptomyces cupreus]